VKRDTIISSGASECMPHKGPHPSSTAAPALTMTTGGSLNDFVIIVRAGVGMALSGDPCGRPGVEWGHSPILVALSTASKNARYLREASPSTPLYESDIAHRWWTLSRDILLPLSDGTTCQLRFPGRPGGSMGPDVRDAVLFFAHSGKPPAKSVCTSNPDGKQVVGDIEFHIRPS
jgi:hypothetical protein